MGGRAENQPQVGIPETHTPFMPCENLVHSNTAKYELLLCESPCERYEDEQTTEFLEKVLFMIISEKSYYSQRGKGATTVFPRK